MPSAASAWASRFRVWKNCRHVKVRSPSIRAARSGWLAAYLAMRSMGRESTAVLARDVQHRTGMLDGRFRPFVLAGILAVAIFCLAIAKEIFIPIAVAMLLT